MSSLWPSGHILHLHPVPFVTGAPELVKLLTEDVEKLTGGKVALGDEPKEIADGMGGISGIKKNWD